MTPKGKDMPEVIYAWKSWRQKNNCGSWNLEKKRGPAESTIKYTRSDLVPSKELLEKVCDALRYFSDDDPESADNCVVRQALALIEPFVREG